MLCIEKNPKLLEIYMYMYQYIQGFCTFSVLQLQAIKHLIIYLNRGTVNATAESNMIGLYMIFEAKRKFSTETTVICNRC